MARVRHTNILNIYDYGVYHPEKTDQSVEYIVMEYIPGNSLRFTMSDEGLDDEPGMYADWVRSYFLPILEGVQAMHQHHIFHRDLKPENIFMDGEIPKIADFGLARSHKLKAVSNSMEMKGTLTYMAPEQFSDFRKADQTADIYALGKLLYEAIDGKLDNKTLPMKRVSIEHYSNIDVPFLNAMNQIIKKATAENKEDRFQTIPELRGAVAKALGLSLEKPDKTKDGFSYKTVDFVQKNNRFIWVGIAFVILAITAMTVWHMAKKPPQIKNLISNNKPVTPHNAGLSLPDDLKELQSSVMATDGSKMILTGYINDNEQKVPSSKNNSVLFFMDENKISNFLFVEFLNAIQSQVVVENRVVKHNGIVLCYLGQGERNEEQIVFQHNRFHVRQQELGANPATRITYHGALAYDRFYSRELLTEEEWIFAYLFHRERQREKISKKIEEEPIETFMMHGAPPKPQKPKADPVLDDMGLSVKEWITIQNKVMNGKQGDQSQVSGVMSRDDAVKNIPAARRQEWEGFYAVGFRTKFNIQILGK